LNLSNLTDKVSYLIGGLTALLAVSLAFWRIVVLKHARKLLQHNPVVAVMPGVDIDVPAGWLVASSWRKALVLRSFKPVILYGADIRTCLKADWCVVPDGKILPRSFYRKEVSDLHRIFDVSSTDPWSESDER